MKRILATLLIIIPSSALAQSWQAIAPMQFTRAESEAVELHDGTILVVGGYGGGNVLSSCEIYDPRTDSWRQTGSLIIGRYRFSLNILPSGKVIALGGLIDLGTGTTPDCEVYDPTTGQWSQIGRLAEAVENFPTTYLEDSTLVYLGGLDANNPITYVGLSGEIDPTSLTRTSISPMRIGTYSHFGQYLPNHRIIIKGGGCIGGIGGYYLLSTEIYHLDTKQWTLGDSLLLPLTDGNQHMVQMPDESLVEPSGRIGDNTTTLNVQAFDPITMRWSIRGQLKNPHFHCYSVLVGQDSILTIGGAIDPQYTQNIVSYTDWYSFSDSSSWIGPPLLEPLHVYACVNDKLPIDDCSHSEVIYVFGGETTGKVQVNRCEKLIIGNKANPPIISLNPSILSTLKLSCEESDTIISISLGNCSPVTLDSISALDNSFEIIEPTKFPITLSSDSQNVIKLQIKWLSSTSSSSAIKLSFQSSVGKQIKYIHISEIDTNGSIASSLSLPSTFPSVLQSSCTAADTEIALGVIGCGSPTGVLDSVWLTSGAGDKSTPFAISDSRSAPRMLATLDSILLSYHSTHGPDTAELHLRYDIGSGPRDTTITVIGRLASPLLAEPERLHRESASAYFGAVDSLPLTVNISSSINLDSLWPYLTNISATYAWDSSIVNYSAYLPPAGWTLTSLTSHGNSLDFSIQNSSGTASNPLDLGTALFHPNTTQLATSWVTLPVLEMEIGGQAVSLCVTDNEDSHWAVKTLGAQSGVAPQWAPESAPTTRIYPNPVGNELSIENSGADKAAVTIYDAIGRVVARASIAAGITGTIDVHSLAPGAYVARMVSGGTQSSQVIVKR